MTFLSRETSVFEGEPFELYQFSRGGTNFNFTNADADKTHLGENYIATPIRRSALQKSQDIAKSNLKIEIEGSTSLAQSYVASSPTQIVSATIFAGHEDEAEIFTLWKGVVVTLSFAGDKATVVCNTIITSFKRNGLRRLYQRGCPHRLYDSATCRANPQTFVINATISAISELTITSPTFSTFADDHFTGGYVEFNTGTFIERALVTDHTASILTLRQQIPSLVAGSSVQAFPGCDRTLNTCINKFSNVENFGGFPWIPEKNPFGEEVF